jgi:hypothetical protein
MKESTSSNEEVTEDIDEPQPVSTSLRSAQHREPETNASADAVKGDQEGSNPSVDDAPEADPDGLNKRVPVSSALRSAQGRASDDGGMDVPDAAGRGDD